MTHSDTTRRSNDMQQIGCQTDAATEDVAGGRRRLQRRTRAALTATGDQAKVDVVVELIQDLTRESVSGQVFTIVRSGRAYEGVRDSKSLQPDRKSTRLNSSH